MSKHPQISLIIPIYNVEAYLEQCLQSVAAQTFDPLEVILVNDGSTDKGASVCDRFLKKNPSWIYIEQSNSGASAARRNGLKRSSGEYIAFLDADDVLAPNYFSDLWAVREETQADLVIAPMYRFYTDLEHFCPPEGSFWNEKLLTGERRVRVFENFSASLAVCGKLIRRELLAQVNFPKLRTGDDILPTVQLISGAWCLALVPGARYYYRQARPGSQSTSGEKRFDGLFQGFLSAREYLLQVGLYELFAPGFERVRMICLMSFMEKFGLEPEQRELLFTHADSFIFSKMICRDWPWKLRVRVKLLNLCLRFRLAYDVWFRRFRRNR